MRWEDVSFDRVECSCRFPKPRAVHRRSNARGLDVLNRASGEQEQVGISLTEESRAAHFRFNSSWDRGSRNVAQINHQSDFHDLRRTLASWMASEGKSLLVIAKDPGTLVREVRSAVRLPAKRCCP